MGIQVYPLRWQSYDLSFSDWISVFTLCLAPLIAHLIAGAPKPSYISETVPRWYDRVGLYNPISIMWRYYAITSRRMRAKQWDRLDMVIANTVFWTSHGWDGSEDLAVRVRSSCYWKRLPGQGRPSLRSVIHTVIVTLQGAQAIIAYMGAIFVYGGLTWTGVTLQPALNSIFFPFAVLGIIRVPSALWLTDEHDFIMPAREASLSETPLQQQEELTRTPVTDYEYLISNWAKMRAEKRYRSSACWRDRVARLIVFNYVLGLWVALWMIWDLWGPGNLLYAVSGLVMDALYMILLAPGVIILACYFVRGNSLGSTVIPCVNLLWYKAYSIVVYVFMLLLVVLAAIETRKTPCGSFSTWPMLDGWWDMDLCKDMVSLRPDVDGLPFGLATKHPGWAGFPNASINGSEFIVSPFVGSCQGRLNTSLAHRAAPINVTVMRGF